MECFQSEKHKSLHTKMFLYSHLGLMFCALSLSLKKKKNNIRPPVKSFLEKSLLSTESQKNVNLEYQRMLINLWQQQLFRREDVSVGSSVLHVSLTIPVEENISQVNFLSCTKKGKSHNCYWWLTFCSWCEMLAIQTKAGFALKTCSIDHSVHHAYSRVPHVVVLMDLLLILYCFYTVWCQEVSTFVVLIKMQCPDNEQKE